MKSGDGTNSLSGTNRYLVVFGKTARVVEPDQRALNNPPLGQNLPSRLDACRNVNAKTQFAGNILLKGLAVSRVSAKSLNGLVFLESISRNQNARLCIMYVGYMHHHRQQTSHCVHYDVPFAPFIPRFSAAEVVFTLCESIIA